MCIFATHITSTKNVIRLKPLAMSKQVMDKIEYLILLVAEFAAHNRVSEVQAYRYLSQYGALALCDKHYNVMHTLSVDENIKTLQTYCQRKGGDL